MPPRPSPSAALVSFSALLDLWPDLIILARTLDLPESTVRAWHRRESVPSGHWTALIAAARVHGVRGCTPERLQSLALAHWQDAKTRRKTQPKRARAATIDAECQFAQGTRPTGVSRAV